MKKILKKLKFLNMKSLYKGATAIEYTLIASLLSVALIGGYKKVGTKYKDLYNGISNGLNEMDKANNK